MYRAVLPEHLHSGRLREQVLLGTTANTTLCQLVELVMTSKWNSGTPLPCVLILALSSRTQVGIAVQGQCPDGSGGLITGGGNLPGATLADGAATPLSAPVLTTRTTPLPSPRLSTLVGAFHNT